METEPLWEGTSTPSRWVRVASIVLLAVVFAVCLLLLAAGAAGWWVFFPEFVALAVVVALVMKYRVRIDSTGIVARAALGVPRISVGASDIAEVREVHVSPMEAVLWWSMPILLGRERGILFRSGPALRVICHNGSEVVITLDDASGAASALNRIIAQPQPQPQPGDGADTDRDRNHA